MAGFKIAEAFVEVHARDDTDAGARRITARLNQIRGNARVNVDVDTLSVNRARNVVIGAGRDMERGLSRLGRLDPFSQLDRRAVKHSAILLGVAGAATVAGGALAALPALGASAAGVGGVLAGSFSGIGAALKAYTADQEAAKAAGNRAAVSAASNARQIRDAQQSIDDARRNQARVARETADAVEDAEEDQKRVARDGAEAVASASRRVQDALDDEREAQEDLTAARVEAARRLDDLREKVSDFALDQEGAAIRVAEAEAELAEVMADATATELDRRKAAYELAVAQERVSDLTREQAQATADLTDAERKGVNGSELVVSAQGRVRDAHRAVVDAEEARKRAARDAAEANEEAAERVSEAVTSAGEAQEDAARAVAAAIRALDDVQASHAESALASAAATNKFAEAMANLTPEGRAFVEQLLRMKPLVRDLRDTSQRSFLPGLTDMLRDSEGLFPIFHGHLERTGTIMGDTARKAGEMFKSDEFKANLEATFRASEPITRATGDLLVNLSGRLFQFGAEMAPAAEGFAGFIDKTVGGLDGMMDNLAPHAEDFRRVWESLGRIMGVLLPVIGDVVGQLAEHLAPALEKTAGWMERNEDKVDDLIFILGGLFLTLKAAKLVGDVSRWTSGVIGLFDGVGRSADANKKKVGGLSGSIKGLGLLALGGAVGAASQLGEDFVLPENPSFMDKTRDMGDTAGKLLSFDFGGVFGKIKRDLASLPEDLARTGDQIRGWWDGDVSETLNSVANGFGDMKTTSSGHLDGLTSSAGRNASNTRGSLSGEFSRLPDDGNTWFGGLRTQVGDRLRELRDSAGQRGSETWSNITGWFGRTRDDAGNLMASLRDRAGDRLRELRDGAWQKGQETWQSFTGWLGRTRDDAGNFMHDMRGRIDGALRGVIDGFWRAVDGIAAGWGRLREAVRTPVAFVVNEVWNRVNDLWGGQDIRGFATGGRVPGSGSGDTVPAMLTPGEFVVRKGIAEPTRRFLEALNAGQAEAVQAAGGQFGRMQKFAEGGPVQRGLDFARAQHGKPYIWGGVGPRGFDCSGFMSAITNTLLGRNPYSRIGATGTMPWPGFRPGLNSLFGLGWFTGNPGHTAGTLAGNNVESGGSPSMTKFVQNAAGATHRQFSRHMSLPMVGGEFIGGGAGGGSGPSLKGLIRDKFRDLTDPLINQLPSPPPQFNELPKGLVRSARDGLLEKALSLVPFDSGGVLPPGVTLAHNATGKPEAVLTPDQLGQLAGRDRGVTVNVIQQSGSPAETGRFVALALRTVG